MKKNLKKILIPVIILGFLIAPISPAFKINKVEAQTTATVSVQVNTTATTKDSLVFDIITKDPNKEYTKISYWLSDKELIIPAFLSQSLENVNPDTIIQPEVSFPKDPDLIDFTQKDITRSILWPGKTIFILVRMSNGTNVVWEPKKIIMPSDSNSSVTVEDGVSGSRITTPGSYELGCSIAPTSFSLTNCVSALLYLIWQIVSYIMELAGKLLDFFMYYSLNSSAYTSIFITQGWGIIRDIANIFFIIALLYIAIKTILNLNVSDNKKLISSIIIVALIINFSLFVTQVVIDSSNILAKVFYNQVTTVKKDNPDQQAELGAGGEKSISTNLLSGFNPQKVVEEKDYGLSISTNPLMMGGYAQATGGTLFIFVTIAMILLCLYTAYLFFTVSILFVGRVVSLWISMIFAPLAFVSYAVPFDLMGFGHKKWWKDLLESAFLAPIFIFFLYIIILFVQLGAEAVKITYEGTADGSQGMILKLMGAIIPFAFIFLLLTRAKKIAVEYSGELGAMVSKIGGMATGLVGGAALGAGAMLARRTVGTAASAIKSSERLKTLSDQKGLAGWLARTTLKGSNTLSKSSFDARNTEIVGGLASKTGLNLAASSKLIGLGVKQGGHEAILQKKTEQKLKEADLYKTKLTDAEVVAKGYKNEKGELITNVAGLDNYRMKQFQDRIGKDGLLSAITYNVASAAHENITEGKIKEHHLNNAVKEAEKKEGKNFNKTAFLQNYENDIAKNPIDLKAEKEKIIDETARNMKMTIGIAGGAVAALATGGLAGLGLAGAIGAGNLADTSMANKSVSRTIEKQTKGFEKLGERLNTLTTAIKESEATLAEGKIKFGNLYDKNTLNLNKEKLADALAQKEVDKEDFSQQLRKMNDNPKYKHPEGLTKDGVKEKLKELNLDTQKLNELKSTKEKIFNLQQQFENARGNVNVNSPAPVKGTSNPTPPTTK